MIGGRIDQWAAAADRLLKPAALLAEAARPAPPEI